MQECGDLPTTALPDFDLQPGKPRNECLCIKLPRTNSDQQDLLDQRRGAIKHGGTLTVEGSYLWDIALLVWKAALHIMSIALIGATIITTLSDSARTGPAFQAFTGGQVRL